MSSLQTKSGQADRLVELIRETMFNKEYFVIMQVSTHHFMPEIDSGRGYTHSEFCSLWVAQPRLFPSVNNAQRALARYLRGKYETHRETGGMFGEEYYERIEVKEGTARNPEDYVIVPAVLGIDIRKDSRRPPSEKTVAALRKGK